MPIAIVVCRGRSEEPDACELTHILDAFGQAFEKTELKQIPLVAEVLVLHASADLRVCLIEAPHDFGDLIVKGSLSGVEY